jgi:cytidylate kinase
VKPITVAIDGPSGSGKSSVARAVAGRFQLAYLDTGAMYRAVALWGLRQGWLTDPADASTQVDGQGAATASDTSLAALVRALPNLSLQISLDPNLPGVWLEDENVTAQIRETTVATVVSQVATNLAARQQLIARQQQSVASPKQPGCHGIVVVGRDITTVVAPDAAVRVLLTASPQARLQRRALEVHGTADAAAIAATADQVLRRDRDDSAAADFMSAADGVTTIEYSNLTLPQVIDLVSGLVQAVATS